MATRAASRLRFLLGLALCAMAMYLPAQPAGAPPAHGTGDAWVDRQLADVSRYGARYRDSFVDELVRYHGAPRALVLDLLERGWPPGDIYYACALGTAAGRPCRHVVDEYGRGEAPDWQAVGERLGVQPGSPPFERLKQGLVSTYGRWGRPIETAPAPDASAPGRPDMHREPPAKRPGSTLPIAPPPKTRDAPSPR